MQKETAALALYLHVPFCRRRCTYCDFNTYAGLESLIPAYVEALAQEIRRSGQGEAVTTLFFGGGTPSLLPLASFKSLLSACREAFALQAGAEISVEANPGALDREKLSGLRRLGVNRLSLGLQSAHADELALLGRIHTFEQAAQAVTWAREAGLENLGLDLLYGLPEQTLGRWVATLRAALRLKPQHISAYCLTVEPDTSLARQIAAGKLPEPDPDQAAQMYELAEATLAGAGFEHYEISNWAKPSYACRHNLVYWRNEEYLGLGAGAHSHRDGRRWWNLASPQTYIQRIQAGLSPEAGSESISPALARGETMMLGLRLGGGVRAARFWERFGDELETLYGQELEELVARGLIRWDGERVCLTARGRLLGNQVFMRFLSQDDLVQRDDLAN
jgi:oxygen-independent coproporphyrinogen III oxidase